MNFQFGNWEVEVGAGSRPASGNEHILSLVTV